MKTDLRKKLFYIHFEKIVFSNKKNKQADKRTTREIEVKKTLPPSSLFTKEN